MTLDAYLNRVRSVKRLILAMLVERLGHFNKGKKGLAPTFHKAYSDGHRHHTPSYLLKPYKRVKCPLALNHDDELDAGRVHNTFDRYQSQGRLGNEMRKFLLMCDLSSYTLYTSKVHFDSDSIVCLFLHNTVDGHAPKSLQLYYCKHMNSKDQRSIACSEMDVN